MSEDYMNTRKDFLMAAASYFGLPEGQLMEPSSMKDDAGTITVCLAVALTPRDMIGISKRMEAMAQMSNGIVTTGEGEKTEGRQVVHIDTPEEAETTNMDAVWLPWEECSQAQMQHAVDSVIGGNLGSEYLVQWAMLTDEQKQKAKEAKP